MDMWSDFEWDETKNGENRAKHGVSFEEAQHAFKDPNRLIIRDPVHSNDEERWFCVGAICICQPEIAVLPTFSW